MCESVLDMNGLGINRPDIFFLDLWLNLGLTWSCPTIKSKPGLGFIPRKTRAHFTRRVPPPMESGYTHDGL